MTRQQLGEVAALGRIRRLAHAPEPSRFFSRVVAQKVLDQRPATNRRDRLIEPCDLARVGIERSFVTRERLAVRAELSQRKRHGEQRFLHRRVRHRTVRQLYPRHQRPFILVERRVRPPQSKALLDNKPLRRTRSR